jgi:hypothetical protein
MKTKEVLTVVLLLTGAAFASEYIRGTGWGYCTNAGEAVAEATAKATAGLYQQCPSGQVSQISVSTTVSGEYVSVDAEATGY